MCFEMIQIFPQILKNPRVNKIVNTNYTINRECNTQNLENLPNKKVHSGSKTQIERRTSKIKNGHRVEEVIKLLFVEDPRVFCVPKKDEVRWRKDEDIPK